MLDLCKVKCRCEVNNTVTFLKFITECCCFYFGFVNNFRKTQCLLDFILKFYSILAVNMCPAIAALI